MSEQWGVTKAWWDKRVKSTYLYVQEGSTVRVVARFLSDEDAQKTLDMLKAVLPEAKE